MPLRKMKRLTALILCAATIFSLAACGGAESDSAQESPETAAPEVTESPEPQPVYEWQAEFSDAETGPEYYTPVCFHNGGFYCTASVKTGENIPESVIKAARKKNEKPVNDGRYDVFSDCLFFIGPDGSVRRIEDYEPLPAEENPGDWYNFSSVSELDGLIVDDAGEIITLEKCGISGNVAPKNPADFEPGMTWYDYYVYDNVWYIRELDENGKQRSCSELINEEGDYFNPYAMKRARDGRLVLAASGAESRVSAVFLKGSIDRSVITEGYITNLITLSTGEIAVLEWIGEDTNRIGIIDLDSFEERKLCDLPASCIYAYDGEGEYLFFWTDGEALYGYTGEPGTGEKLFSWSEAEVSFSSITSPVVACDGGFSFLISDFSGLSGAYSTFFVRMEKKQREPGEEKSVLLLASSCPTVGLNKTVAEFNRSSKSCRVEIADYSAFCDDGLSSAAAFEAYLNSGECPRFPDVIDLSLTDAEIRSLEKAGFLEDLYPFIDADGKLEREDFFENILKAAETNGKLCRTVAGFEIDTAVGAASRVGEGYSWTVGEFMDAWASMGGGTDAFDVFTTRKDVLESCLRMNLSRFVDFDAGSCSFDSPEYTELLYFAGNFPADFDYSAHNWTASDNSDMRVRSGRQMLLRTSIYSVNDVITAGFEFPSYPDGISFIGYPCAEGCGSAVRVSSFDLAGSLGMLAGSEKKEEAWSFLRVFFTEEYEKDYRFIPINRSAYEKQIASAMEFSYLHDKYGKVLYDKKGEKRIASLGALYLSDYTEIKYYPLTQPRADRLTGLIESIDRLCSDEEDIILTALMRSEGFYSGSLSAEDAAAEVQKAVYEILQSR